jgi:hypothetical protein
MRALAAGAAMAAISGAADAAEVTPTNVPGVLAVAPPPAGFNAALASEAERAAYALPPHPDATKRPADYARWQRAMSAKITRPAAALVQTRVFHGPAKFAASQAGSSIRNAYESTNWSGFAARNSVTSYSAQNSFDYVYAEFNIPTAANPTCKGIDYAAQWVGIDGFVGTYGYQSQDVLQAGVGEDVACGYGQATYAWVEWYPNNEVEIPLNVSPGDELFVEIWNVSATVGYAYVADMSTGLAQEYELTPPSGTRLIGNTAEWIIEAPSVNNSQSTMPDFVFDFFWYQISETFGGTLAFAGSSSTTQIDLVQGNALVVVPNLLNTETAQFAYQ